MGAYYTQAHVEFNGSPVEEKKFRRLLTLMNKDGDFEGFAELPLQIYEEDEVVENAVFGKLEDRGDDSDYACRYFPDFDLTLAPKLFAALFPEAAFSMEMSWSYSVGGGETIFYADYSNKELSIRQCQTEKDLGKLTEDIQKQYREEKIDIDTLEDYLIEANGVEKMEPSRNESYEKSFFDGEDLLEYLNSEDK